MTIQFVPPLNWTGLLSCEVQAGRIRKCDPAKTLEVPVRIYCDSGPKIYSSHSDRSQEYTMIQGHNWTHYAWSQEYIMHHGYNLTHYAQES